MDPNLQRPVQQSKGRISMISEHDRLNGAGNTSTGGDEVRDSLYTVPSHQPSILFIDDDPHILHSLGNVLQSLGYKVQCHNDSNAVIPLIREKEFDLVLTDLRMQGKNGLDVLKEVKASQPTTPVVILTGYATLFSAIEALQEGAYDYLVKPCNIQEMRMTVDRGIKEKRITQERDHYFEMLQIRNRELKVAVDELTKAHRRLKENEEFRETMVSMFTHDLFNPVTTIKGFLNILSQGIFDSLNPTYQQYYSIVQRNVKKVEMLIHSFQTFYKIDSQSYQINPVLMDISAVVIDSIKNTELFAMDQSIEFKTAIPESEILILGDHFELERALTNILYNAIKFSAKSGIVEVGITITRPHEIEHSAPLDPAWSYVSITVRDHGIGIESVDQAKIFQKLFRGDNAKKIEGTGVGLFISKFIVDLHRGAILVNSTPGEGSLFTILLPLAGPDLEPV
jgi:signal transduction histidine kinase